MGISFAEHYERIDRESYWGKVVWFARKLAEFSTSIPIDITKLGLLRRKLFHAARRTELPLTGTELLSLGM